PRRRLRILPRRHGWSPSAVGAVAAQLGRVEEDRAVEPTAEPARSTASGRMLRRRSALVDRLLLGGLLRRLLVHLQAVAQLALVHREVALLDRAALQPDRLLDVAVDELRARQRVDVRPVPSARP